MGRHIKKTKNKIVKKIHQAARRKFFKILRKYKTMRVMKRKIVRSTRSVCRAYKPKKAHRARKVRHVKRKVRHAKRKVRHAKKAHKARHPKKHGHGRKGKHVRKAHKKTRHGKKAVHHRRPKHAKK